MDGGRAAQVPRITLDPTARAITTSVTATATGSCVLLGAFLLARRMSGAFENGIGSPWLLSLAVCLPAVGHLLRIGWRQTIHDRRLLLVAFAASSFAVLLAAASLPTNGAATGEIIALCGVLLAGEFASWYSLGHFGAPSRRSPAASATSVVGGESEVDDPSDTDEDNGTDEDFEGELEDEDIPGDLFQQLTRTRQSSGESVSGLVRVEFERGQRTQAAHVAFCPPLTGNVRVQSQQIDGPAATIKSGEVQSFGVRFDLRLKDPADGPINVLFHFDARAES